MSRSRLVVITSDAADDHDNDPRTPTTDHACPTIHNDAAMQSSVQAHNLKQHRSGRNNIQHIFTAGNPAMMASPAHSALTEGCDDHGDDADDGDGAHEHEYGSDSHNFHQRRCHHNHAKCCL